MLHLLSLRGDVDVCNKLYKHGNPRWLNILCQRPKVVDSKPYQRYVILGVCLHNLEVNVLKEAAYVFFHCYYNIAMIFIKAQ